MNHIPSPDLSTIQTKIVKEISGGQITLLNIVQGLGEYLTSDEDEMRSKGDISYCSQIFKIVRLTSNRWFDRQASVSLARC